MRLSDLPESAQALAAVIGEHPALRLLQRYPGRTFDVTKSVNALASEVKEILGPRASTKLCRAYGGSPLYIARCSRAARNAQCALLQQRFTIMTTSGGLSARRAVAQLVGESGLADRTIWRVLKVPVDPCWLAPAASQADTSQLDLFALSPAPTSSQSA